MGEANKSNGLLSTIFDPINIVTFGTFIGSYFLFGKAEESLHEARLRLHDPNVIPLMATSYAIMLSTIAAGLFENFRFNRQYKNFQEFSKPKEGLAARLKRKFRRTINPYTAAGVVIPTAKYANNIADANQNDALREQLPIILMNSGLDAMPFVFVMYYAGRIAEQQKKDKNTWELVKGNFFATFGANKKAAYHYQRADNINPTFYTHILLAKTQIQSRSLEDALMNIKRGIEKRDDDPLLSEFSDSIMLKLGIANTYRKIQDQTEKNPDDLEKRMQKFCIEYLLFNKEQAQEELETAERIAPHDVDLKLLKAQFVEQENGFDSAVPIYSAVIDYLLEDDRDFERIGETVNPVLEYAPKKFIRSSLVFKKGNLDDLVAEVHLGREARRIAEPFGFKVPQPIGYFEKDGEYYSVQKRSPGTSLLEIGINSDYENAAKFCAVMHAQMPRNSPKGEEDIEGKIKAKLYDKNLDANKQLAAQIIWNLAPVKEALKDSVYVFNGDFHPENFLVNPDRTIEGIDWEDKGLVPIAFDLVNLLEYRRHFTWQQKKNIIRTYVDEYNKHSNETEIDYKQFEFAYLNSVIPRAISLCAAWSQPHRKSLRKYRSDILDKAVEAINRIKDEHSDHYTKHKDNYTQLSKSMQRLSNMLYHEH